MERREDHHGDGQGQREAGRQRQEFTERDEENDAFEFLLTAVGLKR